MSHSDKSLGFLINYRDIHLHAICSDVAVALHPHIYMQVALSQGVLQILSKFSDALLVEGEEEEEEEEEDEDQTYEVRFTPMNETKSSLELQEIFHALSDGAALFPDEDGIEGDDHFYYNEHTLEDKAALLSNHLDSLLTIAPSIDFEEEDSYEEGQFADAEE